MSIRIAPQKSSIENSFFFTENINTKVIVIGGGLAGLKAAQKLQKSGLVEVIVLEAKPLPGGRVLTKEINDVLVEYGANWIQGFVKENPFFNFTGSEKKLNYTLEVAENYHDNSFVTYENGKEVKNSLFLSNSKIKKQVSNKIAEIALHSSQSDEENQFILNGAYKIVDYLCRNLQIFISAKVMSIQYLDNECLVTFKYEKKIQYLKVDKVVCTVPLGVLKSKNIWFNPPLSNEKLEAIQKMQIHNMRKVILTFDKPYWSDVTNTCWIALKNQDKKILLFLNLHALNKNSTTLVACFYGKNVEKVQSYSDEQLKNYLLDVLRSKYPECIEENLVDFDSIDWGKDEDIQGAFSSVPSLALKSIEILAKPIGNLYFAGEHTSQQISTMQGALLSGKRAAEEILKTITLKDK